MAIIPEGFTRGQTPIPPGWSWESWMLTPGPAGQSTEVPDEVAEDEEPAGEPKTKDEENTEPEEPEEAPVQQPEDESVQEPEPAPERVNFTTHAQSNEYVENNGIEIPGDWDNLNLADKSEYVNNL